MIAKLPALLLASALAVCTLAASEPVSREIPWAGGEVLIVDVPAEVRFVQTPGPGKVVVTGPRRSVEKFAVTGGVLRDRTLRTGEKLSILVTAPKITRFSAKGGDKLVIEGFDQDELQIEATGRADIKVTGRAGTIKLALQGFGWADLSQVRTQGADVTLSGSRKAVIAPETWASLSGKGAVVLVTKPSTLTDNLSGSGRVIHAYPGSSATLFPASPAATWVNPMNARRGE